MEMEHKDGVFNFVECRSKLNQGLYRYIAFVKRKEKDIINFQMNCFSDLTSTIG